ncbi:HCL247Wp [Eremothecium sinecaudum]|uniref:HCL247Wp n=1 Tax=Eremothecium sinecaudum TaxID=45286 RepID=A0A0X8HR46_9SACH|nr:HCL247Wp [Eremothecium sinecaudum]AMD19904.1 HCL247Wp [Eremothecium sinecaudum]
MISPITFRAGTCEYDEESKTCTPNAMKGEVTIKPSDETAGFYDFIWKATETTASGTPEPIELILIPGETKWLHVKSCKTGRVACLLFSSGEKYFFWMQEKHKKDEPLGDLNSKDEKLFKSIEDILRFEEEDDVDDDDSGDIPMEDAQEEPDQPNAQPIGHIADFLTKDLITSYVQSLDEDSPALAALCDFLPVEFGKGKAELLECLRGPFFSQAVDTLSRNLNEDYGGITIAQALGYQYKGEGVGAFLASVREQGGKEKRQGSENQEEK